MMFIKACSRKMIKRFGNLFLSSIQLFLCTYLLFDFEDFVRMYLELVYTQKIRSV